MKKYALSYDENAVILDLINNTMQEYVSAEDEKFLIQAGLIAHNLPYGLREFLHVYKEYDDYHPICKISNFTIDDKKIGRSPEHWKTRNPNSDNVKVEIFFVLCASIVGYPIAWSTQQGGNIVHEIFPIKEHENDQLGFSSKNNLDWHTEDAFHPLRGDYIALMCIRNPTSTPTLVASNTDFDLTDKIFRPLFEPRFKIKPDNSHLQNEQNFNDLTNSEKAMHEMNIKPVEIPVLFGAPDNPYWRIDPYFMEIPEDEESRLALNTLIELINNNLNEVVLSSGDLLFCDNYRVVHGRSPFSAKHDGWDRWLKRLNIVNDLRKSRGARRTGLSRIFY